MLIKDTYHGGYRRADIQHKHESISSGEKRYFSLGCDTIKGVWVFPSLTSQVGSTTWYD